MFDYYTSHNDYKSTREFLMSGVPPLESSTPCPPNVIAMCSALPKTTQYLQDLVLDELARYAYRCNTV